MKGYLIFTGLVATHLTRVEKAILAQGLTQQVRNVSGEGYKRSTDCISVSAPNKAKCTLALRTAVNFLLRKVRENPDIAWVDWKTALKDRFSDVEYPQQKLKKFKQASGKVMQGYAG